MKIKQNEYKKYLRNEEINYSNSNKYWRGIYNKRGKNEKNDYKIKLIIKYTNM